MAVVEQRVALGAIEELAVQVVQETLDENPDVLSSRWTKWCSVRLTRAGAIEMGHISVSNLGDTWQVATRSRQGLYNPAIYSLPTFKV